MVETATDPQVEEAVKKLVADDFSGAFAVVFATVFGNTVDRRANYVKDKDEKFPNEVLCLKPEDVKRAVYAGCGQPVDRDSRSMDKR